MTRQAVAPTRLRSDEAVLQEVSDNAKPGKIYWLMNALAAVIASYGLFANSAAVIIGAMVVAMLLGPITGIALALNVGNHRLLATATLSLIGGSAWILVISFVIGLVHSDVPLTGEIISRTTPSLFDLMIALASGAAGAVAVISLRVSAAIVGVAVATALVPPLAAAGLLLARGAFALSGGALLIMLTNVIAIEFAFSAVFWISGYHRMAAANEKGFVTFLRRYFLSLFIMLVLALVLGVQFKQTVSRTLFESKVRNALLEHFTPETGFYLAEIRFAYPKGAMVIKAVLRGPKPPSVADVAAVQANLPASWHGLKLDLQVRFIQLLIITPHGVILNDFDAAD